MNNSTTVQVELLNTQVKLLTNAACGEELLMPGVLASDQLASNPVWLFITIAARIDPWYGAIIIQPGVIPGVLASDLICKHF